VAARARRLGGAVLSLVLRRADEHVLQRARSSCRAWSRRPARPDLRLSGHRNSRDIHLPRAARRRRGVRRGACRAGGRARRPRHCLHADGAGGGDCDARLRSARRDSLRGVRRLRGERARNADRGREAEGDRLGVLRDRAQPRRGVQASARCRDRDGRVEAGALHRAPASDARGGAPARSRPRMERCAVRRGAGGVRPGRRRRSALHHLHVGHDRATEGDRPRQRWPRSRARVDDEEHLRRRPGRGLLGRLGHRVDGRSLLHGLRAVAPWLYDCPVRRQAGRDARRGSVLARDRTARRRHALHGADGVPRHPPAGSGRRAHRPLRPLRAPRTLPCG
jgi:hypothetical protein